MSLVLISKLRNLIEEGGSKKKVAAYEDVIVEEIEKYVKEESFYELPTKEILKIVEKSEIDDIELLCEFISRMNVKKGERSTLLLNVIKREEATLDECIKILSKFVHSQICQRTSELFKEGEDLPERDFEGEIKELKEENKKLKNIMKAAPMDLNATLKMKLVTKVPPPAVPPKVTPLPPSPSPPPPKRQQPQQQPPPAVPPKVPPPPPPPPAVPPKVPPPPPPPPPKRQQPRQQPPPAVPPKVPPPPPPPPKRQQPWKPPPPPPPPPSPSRWFPLS